MDSLLVEALAESRRVIENLPDSQQTRRLRWRREALERAAGHSDLETADRQLLKQIACLIVDLRDEAVALRELRLVVIGALEEFMD